MSPVVRTCALLLLVFATLCLGVIWVRDAIQRQRRAERVLMEELEGADRYVDMGIKLHVVVQDDAGDELVPDSPRLRIIRTHHFGGQVDTRNKQFVGPSANPVVWYCSEDQEPLIIHDDDQPLRIVAYGSMGAGKTTALAMWLALRAIEFWSGCQIGGTAPTNERLEMIRDACLALWPSSWYKWRASKTTFHLANGVTIKLISTHQPSKARGSRVQGWNWVAAGSDEIQDSLEVDGDIETRGRKAPEGRYKRLSTATAKDDTDWRNWIARITSEKLKRLWGVRRLRGVDSPFIAKSFWLDLAATLSPREYRRKVDAEDVGPERMTYPTWSRKDNVRRIPASAQDVTTEVLARWGANLTVLGGHDPGTLYDVTEFLKAFRVPGHRHHLWWVVGEVTTEQSTMETHVAEVLQYSREKWFVNRLDRKGMVSADGPQMLVRADPYSESGASDDKPSREVYNVWRKRGVRILPAALIADTERVKVGRVPKNTGIDMICALLRAQDGTRRLFIDCDEFGQPVAPRLVRALESSERDVAGRAEADRKDKHDQSHWPATLRYALWVLEKPRAAQEAS